MGEGRIWDSAEKQMRRSQVSVAAWSQMKNNVSQRDADVPVAAAKGGGGADIALSISLLNYHL